MLIKKLAAVASFCILMACWCAPGWAQAGKPVMYLPVSLLPDNNIIKVSWDPQEGVSGYTVERWEVQGTNFWYFNINDIMKPGDRKLRIGGYDLEPLVFVHPANPGKNIELYDQNVKPGHTYFYRVNGGVISVNETRRKTVTPMDDETLSRIRERQVREQEEIDREKREKVNSARNERQKQYDRLTDYPERMAANLVMAIPNWLVRVIGLYDPLELVFEVDMKDSFKINEESTPVEKTGLIWGTFNSEEFRVVADFYSNASQAMPVFMAVGIVMAGVLMLFNSTSPGAAITAREYILGILVCALLVKTGPYLLGFLFDVNRAIVALCHGVIADEMRQSFLHTVYNKDTRSLGAALLALLGCISIGVINFQFAVRKLFIAVLVGILPIALINAIFPGRRNALAVWFREFASYVFMPAGMAVGLTFFIHFLNSGNFWITLVCLLSLPTINSMVRGALGLSDSGFSAGIGAALGVGALFSMGSMLKGGKDGGSMQALPAGGMAGSPGNPGVAQEKGRTGGAPAGGGPGAALGKAAPGIAGSLARGAASIGVAGSVALAGGIISGAAAGDPGPGMESGINAGRSVVSTLNDTGFNMKKFVTEVKEKGFAGATGIADGAMLLDPGVSASLATRVLGENAVGHAAAAGAASVSRAARAASPLLAPEARERLDQVSHLAAESPNQTADLGREFEKVRQMQQFRNMFEKIKDSQHSGGSGGIYGTSWR